MLDASAATNWVSKWRQVQQHGASWFTAAPSDDIVRVQAGMGYLAVQPDRAAQPAFTLAAHDFDGHRYYPSQEEGNLHLPEDVMHLAA